MSMNTEPAKGILRAVPNSTDFYPREYVANLYRGCNHGCVYCDSRSVCYQIADFDTVRVKENALDLLRSELIAKREPGIVGFGGTSDPYNSFEATEKATRGALSLLAQYGFGVGITTKGTLVTRDIDALLTVRKYAPVHVTFSITCAEDEMSALIEPGAPVSSERFRAMKELTDAGIVCGTWLNPVLPFLTDTEENLLTLLRRTKAAGGQYAICHFGMTLREGDREYYYQALDRHFPGVKEKYVAAFGNAYICPSPYLHQLVEPYDAVCDELKLAYLMEDTHPLIRDGGGSTQLTLF